MLTSNFVTTTMDLFFKCNYMATFEGLIGNKMIVNTIFAIPDVVPYWIKLIMFLIATLPVNFFTAFDDLHFVLHGCRRTGLAFTSRPPSRDRS